METIQKYWTKINIEQLPYDGFDPTGGAVYYYDEQEKRTLIGFISNWDIVKEVAIITLFQHLTLKEYPRMSIILTKDNIISEKLTKKEVRNDIKKAIQTPFEKWMIFAIQGETNG